MNILVVGDKEHERRPVVKTVEGLGHTVTEAEDGTNAWELYGLHHYDVIISDYLMPQMNGLELCRRVRIGPHRDYTYFIIVSARAESQNILNGFRSGVDDYVPKPVSPMELECRLISAQRVTKMHRELARSNAQLKALSDELRAESRRDTLTGVGNRLRFHEEVKGFLDSHQRYGHRFYLGLCDVDNFKKYNDTYGHLEGDVVLKKVAQTLDTGSRCSDHCYRYGGEEFLLVFSEQEQEGAFKVADRLRGLVEELNVEHCQNPPYNKITISIGLAPFVAQSFQDVEKCLERADQALYASKANGRNRVTEALALVNE